MGDQNLARQAERHLEQHGDGESLFFEGQWFSRAAHGRPGVAVRHRAGPGWVCARATGWSC